MGLELTYLLRHGAKNEGLPIRSDGYVNVEALLRHRSLRGLDFRLLEQIVRADKKNRYHLTYEPSSGTNNSWWIRANQGHSMADISLELRRVRVPTEIPIAVHGTTMQAWESISKQGLSRMSRNHIHLAQGYTGDVISGMRSSSEVLIFIDVARALAADIKFYVSMNKVVLTPGNEAGILERRFFSRVERVKVSADPIPGWEGPDGDEDEIAGREGVDEDLIPLKPDRVPISTEDPETEQEKVEREAAEAQKEKWRAAREERKLRREKYATSIRQRYTPSELELV
ncbi:KptA family-domain-containing protein [Mycena galericulata]|nr:KptA family-domain-containing protein [Mycena galericulata]